MPAVRQTAEQARIAEKIAKALGLTIPQSLLLRADQVISNGRSTKAASACALLR